MQETLQSTTRQGLWLLLRSSIDYAGLFPPASLSVEEAVQKFAAHRMNGENWMLSKFVVPALKVADVWNAWKKISSDSLSLSIISRPAEDPDELVRLLDEDVRNVRVLQEASGGKLLVDGWESRLPEAVTHRKPSYATYDLLNQMADVAEFGTPGLREMYFEPSLKGDWKNTIPSVLDSIFRTRVTRNKDKILVRHGFKLRCGGLTAEDFPSIDLVALALRSCKNAQIPMKFTAGLHHPIRNYSDKLYTNQHGFLNIFVAGLLTWAHNPDIEMIKNILNDMSVRRFVFNEDSVGWAPHLVDLVTVDKCRQDYLTTFGSCSISDPVADLKEAGLLQ